jgi:hypothetical protein
MRSLDVFPKRGPPSPALAVSPRDVEALCGATSVAQREGRVKDAQAMTRQGDVSRRAL